MSSILFSAWDKFSNWVTTQWGQTTYIIVVCVLAIVGMLAFLSFFKKSINKDKKPKWGMLILGILMFGILALLIFARV